MTVGAPLVGALRGRIVPRLCRRHAAAPRRHARRPEGRRRPSRRLKDAAPDADPGRRLEESTPPLHDAAPPSPVR